MQDAGLATCPDGNLFGLNGLLQQYNTATGVATEILDYPGNLPLLEGIQCYGDSLFYFTQRNDPGMLYSVDAATGIITELGNTGFNIQGELTSHDGVLYGAVAWSPATNFMNGIVQIDPVNPANTTILVTFPDNDLFEGITSSPFCHVLFGTSLVDGHLYTVNLLDGALTQICAVPVDLWRLSSMLEHMASTICENDIDLDCNNSTGAPDPDFTGPVYDCFSDGVPITDEDIRMWYTAKIASMRVEIVGYMPDAPLEILEVTSIIPALDVIGQNTSSITLVNLGNATATDFKMALRSILYHNLAAPMTAGMRTIEVQFTTNDGELSNVATAYIDVLFNDVMEVDLGADIIICDGENQILDAGNPGSEYSWSTGEDTQTITVNEEGEYHVTVSNGILCPAADTIFVEVLPDISVQIEVVDGACEGDNITVNITTDAPFPVDIVISLIPGQEILLDNVQDEVSFEHTLIETITISIEEIIPSEAVCSIIEDDPVVVEVWPTYAQSVTLTVCEGDSVWINGQWIFTDGTYVELYSTTLQCDSTVTYTLFFTPAVDVWIESYTCVAAEAGVTVSWLPNPDGCFFQVFNQVQYIPPDTTLLFLSTCDESSSGTFEEWTTNQFGCDSLIITNVSWIPGDSTFLIEFTCDIQLVGTDILYLSGEEGCDSIVVTEILWELPDTTFVSNTSCNIQDTGQFLSVIVLPDGCDHVIVTTITYALADTTYIYLPACDSLQFDTLITLFQDVSGCDSLVITATNYILPTDTTYLYEFSCDSSSLGLSQYVLKGYDGCDSLIILTVTAAPADTTFLYESSCDSSSLGVTQYTLTGIDGCDSLIITTVSLGSGDTTLIFTTTCDPAGLGVFEEVLLSSQGCDSLIITTVSFSAQDSTFLSSSTCDPTEAGIFVTSFINQIGCDSIVTETISLLPSDTTFLSYATCDPSAAGVFTIMLTNQFGCDSIVTETVALLPGDQTSLASTTCIASEAGVFITTLTNQYSCDSVITETITFIPGDTTSFVYNTCDPTQVGNIQTTYTGEDGCDSLVIETTVLNLLPVLTVQSTIDYNGFDISCADGTDGSAIAYASGLQPFAYLWSTNDTDMLITGLGAGTYTVSVTDGNGCTTDGVITLTEPDVFRIGFEVSEPDCFDQQLGSIKVKPNGGVAPYSYSIDGATFQSSPDFTGLGEGIYQITSLDANDCSATEIISIDMPLKVDVELGDNQIISLGDSSQLQAIVNLPFDSLSGILWSGIDNIDCPNCLTQLVAPIITTAYAVSVTSVDGCADRDSMILFVKSDQKVYIPNIFSPNGDGVNDELSISLSGDVQEVSSFSIFDRWGNLVFGVEHFLPNDQTVFWNGKLNGETMNPGVFTFRMVIVFGNGASEVRYGDVTLLK